MDRSAAAVAMWLSSDVTLPQPIGASYGSPPIPSLDQPTTIATDPALNDQCIDNQTLSSSQHTKHSTHTYQVD